MPPGQPGEDDGYDLDGRGEGIRYDVAHEDPCGLKPFSSAIATYSLSRTSIAEARIIRMIYGHVARIRLATGRIRIFGVDQAKLPGGTSDTGGSTWNTTVANRITMAIGDHEFRQSSERESYHPDDVVEEFARSHSRQQAENDCDGRPDHAGQHHQDQGVDYPVAEERGHGLAVHKRLAEMPAEYP